MLRIIILVVLIGSVLFGYLLYKIWFNHKRKRQVGIALAKSENSSTRERSKKRRKSSRVKKRKISKRRKTKKKKRKTSIHPEPTDEHTHSPEVTIQPIPQTFKPMNSKIESPFYQLDENRLNKKFVPIARRRSKIDNKKSLCLCMNCNDPYSSIIQARNNVDVIKYVLPCDENDTANVSKYDQAILATQIKSCEVCIVNSICTDDTIYFNISISEYCQTPLNAYFTYYTDTDSKPGHYHTTATCTNCHISVSIDSVQGAWDYTLAVESSEPSKTCSTRHIAHCEGRVSQIMWFIIGGLSGLFIVLGLLLCCLKHRCFRRTHVKTKKNKMVVAVINA